MADGPGWLVVNGERCEIASANCDLFAGELALETTCYRPNGQAFDFGILNLPCNDAVEYVAAQGKHIKCDSNSEVLFSVACADSEVTTLDCRFDYDEVANLLVMAFSLEGYEWDIIGDMVPRQFEVSGLVMALCELPPGDTSMKHQVIPARFASFYLSRLGVRAISSSPTREEVFTRFGPPARTADNPRTIHPESGSEIPDWTIHRFADFDVRCGFEGDNLTHVMVMGLSPGSPRLDD